MRCLILLLLACCVHHLVQCETTTVTINDCMDGTPFILALETMRMNESVTIHFNTGSTRNLTEPYHFKNCKIKLPSRSIATLEMRTSSNDAIPENLEDCLSRIEGAIAHRQFAPSNIYDCFAGSFYPGCENPKGDKNNYCEPVVNEGEFFKPMFVTGTAEISGTSVLDVSLRHDSYLYITVILHEEVASDGDIPKKRFQCTGTDIMIHKKFKCDAIPSCPPYFVGISNVSSSSGDTPGIPYPDENFYCEYFDWNSTIGAIIGFFILAMFAGFAILKSVYKIMITPDNWLKVLTFVLIIEMAVLAAFIYGAVVVDYSTSLRGWCIGTAAAFPIFSAMSLYPATRDARAFASYYSSRGNNEIYRIGSFQTATSSSVSSESSVPDEVRMAEGFARARNHSANARSNEGFQDDPRWAPPSYEAAIQAAKFSEPTAMDTSSGGPYVINTPAHNPHLPPAAPSAPPASDHNFPSPPEYTEFDSRHS